MERQDKKVIMTAYGEKLTKAIAREKSIKMEKENDKYLLKALLAEKHQEYLLKMKFMKIMIHG